MTRLLLVALLAWLPLQQAALTPDPDGFIRDWLVLAPIPLQGQSGADDIDTEFIFAESQPTPRDGDRTAAVGAQDLTWRAHHAPEYFVDFLKAFGQTRGEYVVAYAVTYVTAGEAMDVTLALGTNDQGKATIPDLAPGSYQVGAKKDGMTLAADRSPASVSSGGTANVRVVLKPGS